LRESRDARSDAIRVAGSPLGQELFVAKHGRSSDWSELQEKGPPDGSSWPNWRVVVTAGVLAATLCLPALVLRFQ
jgi:hypothetical protein